MHDEIPFHRPAMANEDIDAVAAALRSGWLTTGGQVAAFEAAFADYVGADHAVALNSCTAALHLALAAHGVGPGDEVIVPTLTFTATAEVVVHLGARPVLVDVKEDTLTIDPIAAKEAVTDRTRAIIPVHYGGHPADMDEIMALVQPGLIVIEDAAHALPTEYRGRRVGSISSATCFSFYATKTITTGEGGMLTTNDRELADSVRSLSLHGLSRDAWKRLENGAAWDYKVLAAGYKYNMTDSAAALGLSQLERADDFRRQRAAIAARYDELFAGVDGVAPIGVTEREGHAWHLYVVRIDPEHAFRNEVIDRLAERGIGTSVHYRPLHMHPFYQEEYGYRTEDFPVAARVFDEIVSLPIFPGMSDEELDRVAGTLIDEVTGAG